MTATPGTADTLAFAKYYLELGLHPIPLSARTKVPPRGFPLKRYQTQRPTSTEIQSWFADGSANVGLILGRGVIAVDFDGPGSEELLTASGIELPEDAPRSCTANGAHVLLSVNDAIGNRVEMLASTEKRPDGKPVCQVDIRGDGGYIVAPPSVHPSGHVYEWDRRVEKSIPAAPAALLELINRTGTAPAKPSGASQGAAGGPEAPKWVTEALRGVRKGLRDVTCTKLAGYFLGKNIPADIVREQLRGWAGRCQPPFEHSQIDKCVDSVTRRDVASRAESAAEQAGEFQVLGYNQGSYFYLPRGSRQVVELRAEQHSKLNLLRLAPLQYWEYEYAGRQGVQWDMAANALMRQCELAGVYDAARIRGRGAWWDQNGAILHVGDSLIIGDARVPIGKLASSHYVYEAAAPIDVELETPLNVDEAHKVLEIAELFNWEHSISARLFAGWCAVAPICGALSWRPHIWITGPAGSGKTWITENVARRLLGSIGLAVLGDTTEAGVRQTLGHDARPIVFDEADGENERSQQRIQNILMLARQASSETGASIVKGTPGGIAKSYRIRSCFAFSGISPAAQQHADSTRVSVLGVEEDRREDKEQRFKNIQAVVGSTFTDEYVRRFIARSIRLVPQIRANAQIFAAAGAAVIGSQRLGDQIGALLAGCYSLFAEDAIGADEAREWIEQQNWTEQRSIQDVTDESRCLQRILEHVVRVQTKSFMGERSVAELIRSTALLTTDAVQPADAEEILWRMGIRVDRQGNDQDFFTISNSHTAIEEILAGTPWSRGWARMLRRVRGAAPSADPVRFGAIRSRGVEIPLEVIE